MAVKQLQDFGEKNGGAKKDLWREWGLFSDDLDAMNDREAAHPMPHCRCQATKGLFRKHFDKNIYSNPLSSIA